MGAMDIPQIRLLIQERELAEKALCMAHSPDHSPAKVVERAKAYYDWLIGDHAKVVTDAK